MTKTQQARVAKALRLARKILARRSLSAWIAAAIVLLGAASAGAQGSVVFQETSGSITATATTCATAAACVVMPLASRTSNASLVVTGTWVATLTFEGTVADMTIAANRTAGSPTWFALNVQAFGSTAFVTTATANGQWVGGYALTGIRVRASAYTSGTADVAMLVTSARGSGGGGGGISSGASGVIQASNGSGGFSAYAGATACTNQFFTGLSNAGASTCTTATLASAQYENQGTATTVLHGNAAGNPTWSAVSLTADVSGILPGANGGTNNAFMAFTGPATSLKTFTLPNASSTIATGTGTTNVTPKWTGTGGTLGDGCWTDDGALMTTTTCAAIGLGTATPKTILSYTVPAADRLLHIAGTGNNTVIIAGDTGADFGLIDSNGTADRRWLTMRLTGTAGTISRNTDAAAAGATYASFDLSADVVTFGGTVATAQYNVAARLAISPTAPTVSGFCTSPTVPANNGTAAFTIQPGTICAGISTGTITLPAATTAWACTIQNVTTPASYVIGQTGGTTTTATITNYSRTTGLAIAWNDSDVHRVSCMAY